jgi:hypothetical protein
MRRIGLFLCFSSSRLKRRLSELVEIAAASLPEAGA